MKIQINKRILRYAVVFGFGSLFGSGAVWQYLNWKTERSRADVELASQTAALHEKLNDSLLRVIDLSRRTVSSECRPNSLSGLGKSITGIELDSQLELAKSEFSILESKLATLENRAPRAVNLEFIPPASVTGVTVTDESGRSVYIPSGPPKGEPDESSRALFVHAGPIYYHRPTCQYLMNPVQRVTVEQAGTTYAPCPFCIRSDLSGSQAEEGAHTTPSLHIHRRPGS